MVKVVIYKKRIELTGHADYQDFGKDIVCASISSIVYTTVNSILNIDDEAISFIDENNKMIINVLKNDNITKSLLDTMVILLEDLSNDYPKNIKISKGE